MSKNIVIIGGYGKVGLATAADLVKNKNLKITLAGRDLSVGRKLAAAALNPRELELLKYDTSDSSPAMLEKLKPFDLVLVCIDQTSTAIAEYCLRNGIHYVDVTASDEFHRQVEAVAKKITPTSAALLSVGIAPGISNLLAKTFTASKQSDEPVNMTILLGNGEKHGAAAVQWTLVKLFKSIFHRSDEIMTVYLGEKAGRRKAFPFDFSDQHAMQRSFPKNKFVTRLAFEQRLLELEMRLLYKMPWLAKLVQKIPVETLASVVNAVSKGSDIFVLKAEHAHQSVTVQGFGEGRVTGIVASRAIQKLLERQAGSGVHHIHDLWDFSDFQKDLHDAGCVA